MSLASSKRPPKPRGNLLDSMNPMFSPVYKKRTPTARNMEWLEEHERKQASENAAKGLPPVYTGTPSTKENANAFYRASRMSAMQNGLPGSQPTQDEIEKAFTGVSSKGGSRTRRRNTRKAKKSRKNKNISRRR